MVLIYGTRHWHEILGAYSNSIGKDQLRIVWIARQNPGGRIQNNSFVFNLKAYLFRPVTCYENLTWKSLLLLYFVSSEYTLMPAQYFFPFILEAVKRPVSRRLLSSRRTIWTGDRSTGKNLPECVITCCILKLSFMQSAVFEKLMSKYKLVLTFTCYTRRTCLEVNSRRRWIRLWLICLFETLV